MNENENAQEGLEFASPEPNTLISEKPDFVPDINKQNKMNLSDSQEDKTIENNEHFLEDAENENIDHSEHVNIGKIGTDTDRNINELNNTLESQPIQCVDRNDKSPLQSIGSNDMDIYKDTVNNTKSDSLSDSDNNENIVENSDKISVQSGNLESEIVNIASSISETIAQNENDQNDLDDSFDKTTNWQSEGDGLSATQLAEDSSVENGECHNVQSAEQPDSETVVDEEINSDAPNDSTKPDSNDEKLEENTSLDLIDGDENNSVTQNEKNDEQVECEEPSSVVLKDIDETHLVSHSEEKADESKDATLDIDDDNKTQPEFECAPEQNLNDGAVEDQSQHLDPFNELLKDAVVEDNSAKETDSKITESQTSNENNETSNEVDSIIEPESVTDAAKSETDQTIENISADGEGSLSNVEKELDEVKKSVVETPTSTPNNKRGRKKDVALSVKPNSLLMKNELTANRLGPDSRYSKRTSTRDNSNHEGKDKTASKEADELMDVDNVEADGDAKSTPLESGAIQEIYEKTPVACHQCSKQRPVLFRFLENDVSSAICSNYCLKEFRKAHKDEYTLKRRKITVEEINPGDSNCAQCNLKKSCIYKERQGNGFIYFCSDKCVHSVISGDKGRDVTKHKKVVIRDIELREETCRVCSKKKMCRYETTSSAKPEYICDDGCLGTVGRPETTKTTRAIRKKKHIEKSPKIKTPLLKLKVLGNATDKYLEKGTKVLAKTASQAATARDERERSFRRSCSQCQRPVDGSERNLSWETMDFCDEGCLGKYQNLTGSNCANCKVAVNQVSLGKYCVRFGYDVRQFCCSRCLEEFKKGLKICCYCQRDITGDCEGFLAPVGDKGQFKDFCSQPCMEKFDQMSKNPSPPAIWSNCAVCSHQKLTNLEVEVDGSSQRLCSEPCFAAFKFVNNVFPDQCRWCKKYFERKPDNAYTIYTDTATHCFCSKACFNVYISNSRHIVPCNWCKVKKYNFDMIKKTLGTNQQLTMCSLNCLTLYQVSINAVSSRRVKCDKCGRVSQAQYHLTMSDATVRNFCTYQCVMSFQGQYSKSVSGEQGQPTAAVPTGAPRRTTHQRISVTNKTQLQNAVARATGTMPVISNVESLAVKPNRVREQQLQLHGRHQPPPLSPLPPTGGSPGAGGHATRAKSKAAAAAAAATTPTVPKTISAPIAPVAVAPPPPPPPPRAPTPPPPPPKIYSHVLIKPPPPVEVRNMGTSTTPLQQHRAVSCRPQSTTQECQTGPELERRVLIPVPVPIYVPVPVGMYSMPFPVPIPIPLPIPTPVFIPTTRNSAEGIMKEIKKIHDKMPTDPFEAELLMMAEMVAGEKKKGESDSDTDEDNDDGFSPADGGLEPTHSHNNNAFGEDMLQMALKLATEYDEPAVDLESAMQANTITPAVTMDEHQQAHHHQQQLLAEQQRAAAAALAMRGTPTPVAGRKRGGSPGGGATGGRRSGGKRRRDVPAIAAPPMPEPPAQPQEKPDANMCLKYTFGVNAWKQWVMTKNAEMEKSTIRRKPFKSEILQLTADELNYSLCLFVKEVRKPNGSEYAPDTIYYLVLGIQQYLFENGRIDNIFTDPYYEKFTECLDEVARKFSVLYNDSQYIVTRVEEEHLWESKQLGAHSPHVLLSTLMFFNTKHFNLVTVEEHMQLSFSHIMKHWKRNPNSPGAAKMPGSRNVLLRFYPPQSALEANSRKKKVYEQQENEENPLRCPVKLYEFYLSKCPESVKTRNDVFYLLPERSCVPDSPVWYSTQALAKDALAKMLHRVKMVKEINIALLTS